MLLWEGNLMCALNMICPSCLSCQMGKCGRDMCCKTCMDACLGKWPLPQCEDVDQAVRTQGIRRTNCRLCLSFVYTNKY